MKTQCPSCKAENTVDDPTLEVVCWSCFHAWIPAEESGDDSAASPDESASALDPESFPSFDIAELVAEAESEQNGDVPPADDVDPFVEPEGSAVDTGGIALGGGEEEGPGEIALGGVDTDEPGGLTPDDDSPEAPSATALGSQDDAEPEGIALGGDAAGAFALGGGDAAEPSGIALGGDTGDGGAFALGGSSDASTDDGGIALGAETVDDVDSSFSSSDEVLEGSEEATTTFGEEPVEPPVPTDHDTEVVASDVEETAPSSAEEPATDTSFLFKRRRHRSSSQTDEQSGRSSRSSRSTTVIDDVVWDPNSAPPPPPKAPTPPPSASSAPPSDDIFGNTEVVWGDSSGGGTSSGWGTETGANAGPDSSTTADPFAASDPFGSSGGADQDDDPFGSIDSGGDFSDDPFASSPFGASDDPFGSGDDNPFSTAAFADANEDANDGFGLESGTEVGEDDDPFGASDFEIDTSSVEPGEASPSGKAPKRRRRRGRASGDGKAKKAGLFVTLIVVLIGVGLGQTDLGYFGMDAILGSPSGDQARPMPKPRAGGEGSAAGDQAAAPGARKAAKRSSAGTSSGGDAPADYARRIEALKKKLAARPSKATEQELVQVLLRCKDRHPSFFAEQKYDGVLKAHATEKVLAGNQALRTELLLAEGKVDEARSALMQDIAAEQKNPEILYKLARISSQGGDMEKAIEYYKLTIATDPGHQAARYDLGAIYIERKDFNEAKAQFAALLESNSSHSSAKLAMAQITLYEKGFDEAKALIEEALSTAKDSKNTDEQFRAFWLQATLAEAQQNLEDKRFALSRALELRPSDEATALALSELLNAQGKHQEALLKLQACQKEGGSSAVFYKELVETYEATNDPDNAKSQLSEALRKHPKDTGLLMLQADGERRAEHFKTAKSIYASVIENDPGYIYSYLALSTLLFQEERHEEAIGILSQGAEVVAEKLPIMEKQAEFQMKIGATLKAKETMAKILAIDPNNNAVKLRFATLLKSLGYADEASRYYKDLNVAGALDAVTLLDYADVLVKLKRYDQAFKHVETVISTDPLDLRANILRGAIRTSKGEYAGADEDLQKALKVNSQSARAFYYMGLNELAQKKLEKAVSYLAKAAGLSGDDLDIRADLARAYTMVGGADNRRKALGHYTHIISAYEKFTSSLEKKRIDPTIYFRRGQLFYDNGQHREALADFKEAMILDPVREDTVIEFARTLSTMGKRSEAEAYLKEVLNRDPKNPSAHYEMGEIALRSERKTQAEDHFKKAIAAGGANFPKAHRYLGFLYRDKGLTTLSCNSFREYLKVAPKRAYDREEIARQITKTCR